MKKMKKRLLWSILIVLLIGILGPGIYIETHILAPRRLTTVRLTFASSELPSSFDGIRVLFFSDLHLFDESMENPEQVFASIQALRPDVILFGGDFIDDQHTNLSPSEEGQILEWLKTLHAPLGKFAVLGESDLPHRDALSALYANANVSLLQGETVALANYDQDQINLHSTLALARQSSGFNLLLSYDSTIIQQAELTNIHLILSAKTHGGQVNLPLIGPLYPKAQGDPYRGSSLNTQPAYVISNGIATLEPRYRLLTDPSLYLITLRKQP